MQDNFKMKSAQSFYAKIWIAGDVDAARLFFAQRFASSGLCVTISKTLYVYSGGEESGMVVGLVNYPKFPLPPEQILAKATSLGECLARHLGQGSYLIETPNESLWFSRRDGD